MSYWLCRLTGLIPVVMAVWQPSTGTAQSVTHSAEADSLPVRTLQSIDIRASRAVMIRSLPTVQGTFLMAGKRSALIPVADLDVNVVEKNARQMLGRVPGLFVYDMDGTGNQINVATRGLDPHRSWENNIRQNGVLTNSDMYAYPASHYSPPGESLEQIEWVSGSASLQYGAQFGGMLNYVTKQADTTRRFGFETIGSLGSFGLRSSYNAVGGRIGKLTYYGYAYWRHSDGYRANSRSDAQAQLMRLSYQLTPGLTITAEAGRSAYVYQIPGPLTDSMFRADPRQATRSRNYFNPDIWVPSVRVDWQLDNRTRLQWTTSAVLGQRNSVQLDAFATVPDAVDPATGQYKPRQVDVDQFNSYTSEVRLLRQLSVAGITSTVVLGGQFMHNDLHRQQLGKGTTGSAYDLTLTAPFGRDLWYRTRNGALFAEAQVRLGSRLTISPGIRMEQGLTRMRGTISYYDPGDLPTDIAHRFALPGFSAQYQLTRQLRLYGGWTRAYRPVIFKDIIPASVYERVDKNLQDALGHTAELGLEGYWSNVHLNLTLFDLLYRNRLGSLVQVGVDGASYILRTNIGDSRSQGIEALAEAVLWQSRRLTLSMFSASAFIDARYVNAVISAGTDNRDLTGNRVESAPRWTSRNGLTIRYGKASLTAQYSYVGPTFSDALNSPEPSANGARGPVPGYSLLDLNASWRIRPWLTWRGSLNNLLDQAYFTKRPTFYPGPGIWPSDGRSGVITLGIRL
ncbi:TonB-dependent receptor domain-containing protein [Spirosoma sp. 209]|uniref:TonB-dependent receptor family protein n=1 Tax=Spirosoma sp. 209 TaxID=1955701 RepID=UPI00098D701D|nr:TonB-dependent receptor [Spirosoma sp. 209]